MDWKKVEKFVSKIIRELYLFFQKWRIFYHVLNSADALIEYIGGVLVKI